MLALVKTGGPRSAGASARRAASGRLLTGILLAGGASRRMGRDKRRLVIEGVPLLRRAALALAGSVDQLLVVEHPDRPVDRTPLEGLDVEIVADLRRGGPLAGIEAGLLAASHEWTIVAAADMPWLHPGVLGLIAAAAASADEGVDAIPLAFHGELEPLLAAYRRRILPVVGERLDRGDRRLRSLLDALRILPIPEAAWNRIDPEGRSVANLNTPHDLTEEVVPQR